jgi:hypothetical protein
MSLLLQLMSPEDDPFLDSTMQVDNPPPPRPSRVFDARQTLQIMCKQLQQNIQPGFDNDDEYAQGAPDIVWVVIHNTLQTLERTNAEHMSR